MNPFMEVTRFLSSGHFSNDHKLLNITSYNYKELGP
jgi:hypothetical protein